VSELERVADDLEAAWYANPRPSEYVGPHPENGTASLFDQRAPAQEHSETSTEAAESLTKRRRASMRLAVLEWLTQHGPATDEAIAEGLSMNPNTARPRRVELQTAGLIVGVGHGITRSGRRARLWDVAPDYLP
jgi:hypothetical protein